MKNLEFENIMDQLGLKGDNKGTYYFMNFIFRFENGCLKVIGEVPSRLSIYFDDTLKVLNNYFDVDIKDLNEVPNSIDETNGNFTSLMFVNENSFLVFFKALLDYYKVNGVKVRNVEKINLEIKKIFINKITEKTNMKLTDYNRMADHVHESYKLRNIVVDSLNAEVMELIGLFNEYVYRNVKKRDLEELDFEFDGVNSEFKFKLYDDITSTSIITKRGLNTLVNNVYVQTANKDFIEICYKKDNKNEELTINDCYDKKTYFPSKVLYDNKDLEYIKETLKKVIFLSESTIGNNKGKQLIKK